MVADAGLLLVNETALFVAVAGVMIAFSCISAPTTRVVGAPVKEIPVTGMGGVGIANDAVSADPIMLPRPVQ